MSRVAQKQQGERDPGASVLQRLRNHAKATGDDTALLLTRYVIERFLYRLSVSPHRGDFVLRGATLFSVWTQTPHRPTRDVDLLARGDNSAGAMASLLRDVFAVAVPEDGVHFLADTLAVEERGEGRAYPGLHAQVTAALSTSRPRLEIDIAFGEAGTPPAQEVEVPTVLSAPRPRLLVYPRETAVAEKTEALVSLGVANTRLKDFFDLWYLSRGFPMDGETLSAALSATFGRRGTDFPTSGLPIALTEVFYDDAARRMQWQNFRRKALGTTRAGTGADLADLMGELRAFLVPPLAALAVGAPFRLDWLPGQGWQAKPEPDTEPPAAATADAP